MEREIEREEREEREERAANANAKCSIRQVSISVEKNVSLRCKATLQCLAGVLFRQESACS